MLCSAFAEHHQYAVFFFLNDPAPPEISPLPYTTLFRSSVTRKTAGRVKRNPAVPHYDSQNQTTDRKSTRLNSSHLVISYAVFCLKKKTNIMSYRYSYHWASE